MNPNQQQSVDLSKTPINAITHKNPIKSTNFESKASSLNTSKSRKKKKLFSKEEDSNIIQAINKYGDKNWNIIASFVPGRTQRQCRERWYKFLCPTINHSNWTQQEDQLLLQKVIEYGQRWSFLCRFFKNRIDVNLKARYAIHKRKLKREQEFLSHYKIISKDAISFNISSIEKLMNRKEKSSMDNDKKSYKKSIDMLDYSFESNNININDSFDDFENYFNDINPMMNDMQFVF